MKGRMKKNWFKVLIWIATIMLLAALVGERFLPQIVVATLAFVGIAILVVIVIFLMDDKE